MVAGLGHVYDSSPQPIKALEELNLSVPFGSFLSVIGPSGAGKTTLLKILGGLISPSHGTITIDGKSPEIARKSKRLGYVFQTPALLPWRSVYDNVALPLQLNKNKDETAKYSPEDAIAAVGLSEFSKYHPHQLSGGMLQKVTLARAIVMDPDVLLMDEPLGGLDDITRTAMRYEILRISENFPRTIILVTHSIAEAVIMSDIVAVMSSTPGRIVKNFVIDLPRPRNTVLETSKKFAGYVNELSNTLAEEADQKQRANKALEQ